MISLAVFGFFAIEGD